MDLTDVYKTFHPTAAEDTLVSSAQGTFFSTDHILGHKTRLNKFKKSEIILGVISDNNDVKLEITRKLENSQICGG